jgi:hypothetical protein
MERQASRHIDHWTPAMGLARGAEIEKWVLIDSTNRQLGFNVVAWSATRRFAAAASIDATPGKRDMNTAFHALGSVV